MTVSKAPVTLIIQLKRFAFGTGSGKVNKHVSFSEHLDLPCNRDATPAHIHETRSSASGSGSASNYGQGVPAKPMNATIAPSSSTSSAGRARLTHLKGCEDVSVRYALIGIIMHHGHSLHSGHYVAYVKVLYASYRHASHVARTSSFSC